ncbi:tetratricopeptide repeat-containing sensor histidine kinase [Aquimarina brevivitae]|uniref:Tetratricopeptide repeat protein n=1 Tax=Aquimarina brevivitae TaxID=323412 RepID=A0A4Q7PEJ2_9FLAO|nr:histidine kinase [Aquimarina brevivitae]RZS98834.1 tetratricopeptide repeat protein [Aquimarina brevivitae]
MKKIIALILFLCPFVIFAQVEAEASIPELFDIKGSVKEAKTLKPVQDVEIQVLGKGAYVSDQFGNFRIQATIGDQLVIRHPSFETIFHTVTSSDRIDIKVKENPIVVANQPSAARRKSSLYQYNIQSARTNLKKDAATSIDFAAKALESITDDDSEADAKKATLYELLGDIYGYWNQPDLAASNYLTSLSNRYDSTVQLKMAKVQYANGSYNKALKSYKDLLNKVKDKGQLVQIYEGIADAYDKLDRFDSANTYYTKALDLAKSLNDSERIIQINSKLAEVLQKQGKMREANSYLDNSVQLAEKTSKKAVARQRSRAADMYSKSNRYTEEIALRQQALKDIEELEGETKSDTTSTTEEDRTITPQVQNYKIANAFAAQSAYEEAIPYLKESIKEAESRNDLVVQKDATRKLGEVYREKGELKKASEVFEEYEAIIDKLYIQKEQEIAQAARLSRELVARANRITTLEKDRELNENRYNLVLASQELAKQQAVKQKVIIYALIGVMLLFLLAGYLMYRNIRQQKYANNLLALKSLRSQMNPHFIFNALNSVNTFIATNDELAANRYLTDFSLLMRSVLENSEEDFIPLSKEIELISLYVKLEHFRFQDKFDYQIHIDPTIAVDEYVIPPMLLQPYVENAVWHGLRYKENDGQLTIAFTKLDEHSIEILISDNGIGRQRSKELKTANQKRQRSQGMSNIKKRITILNAMYKDKVDVEVEDLTHNGEGTVVRLVLKKDKN